MTDEAHTITWCTWKLYCAIYYRELVVLGPKCETTRCLVPATFIVFWPGQTRLKCRDCLSVSMELAIAMGFELQSKTLDIPVGEDDSAKRFSMMELD